MAAKTATSAPGDEEPTEDERYEGPRAAGRLDLLAEERDEQEDDRQDRERRAQLYEERGGPRQPVFRRTAVSPHSEGVPSPDRSLHVERPRARPVPRAGPTGRRCRSS
jgi:hypothetical protein